tara:strand:+ start:904 stop:1185 length:282 start_codon:yes stop_codon:yes gene_type:complete
MTNETKNIYAVRKAFYVDEETSLEYLLFNDMYVKTFEYKEGALDYYNEIYYDEYESGKYPTIFRMTVSNLVQIELNVVETVKTQVKSGKHGWP